MSHQREGLYGINPLLEALRAGSREFDKVYIAKGVYGKGVDEIINVCRRKNIPVHFESRDSINRMAGTAKHQGIYGVAAVKAYSTVEEILDLAKEKKENPFILILDGVEDPRNLGAIIRTANGAGVHGIIIPKHRASGLSSTVAKTSSGAIEFMKIVRSTNLINTMRWLKDQGVWIYGLDMEGEKEYTRGSFDGPLAIVIGGEGRGIRDSVSKACDIRVRIPLHGQINSLNVSVAAGVILFEIAKHRSQVI